MLSPLREADPSPQLLRVPQPRVSVVLLQSRLWRQRSPSATMLDPSCVEASRPKSVTILLAPSPLPSAPRPCEHQQGPSTASSKLLSSRFPIFHALPKYY